MYTYVDLLYTPTNHYLVYVTLLYLKSFIMRSCFAHKSAAQKGAYAEPALHSLLAVDYFCSAGSSCKLPFAASFLAWRCGKSYSF